MGVLFFSTNDYSMGEANFYYEIHIEESDIASVSSLYTENAVAQVVDLFDCDEELAEELLDGSSSEWSLDNCDADKSWRLQGIQAHCAKEMGFIAVETEDENGTVYAVAMNDSILSKMTQA